MFQIEKKHSVPSRGEALSPSPTISRQHFTTAQLKTPFIESAVYFLYGDQHSQERKERQKIPESTLLSHILYILCVPVKVQEHRADVNLPKALLNHDLSYFYHHSSL